MRLDDIGEFGLIERIRRSFAAPSQRAPIGIGDDAAALCVSPGHTLLATTDMLVEGVHFDLATTDLYSLGWKSAAVNLSDIAAMGGTPRFCMTALAIPRRITVERIAAFYRGLHAIARKHGVVLVGGDTCSSKRDLVISIAMLGEARRKKIVTRSGARPGDLVYVTGTLGDSGAGLELVRSSKSGNLRQKTDVRKLIERHLRPVPRVAWGRMLAESGSVSAMIDVSDGLSSDLGHLCEESGVGAEITGDRIPLSRSLRRATGLRQNILDYALSGGEDYELLFTVPPRREKTIPGFGIDATNIGVVTKGRSLRFIDDMGSVRLLQASGYDHFKVSRRGRAR
ncbi:MAG: thiamine-phosphate kinase [Nitrospirota bacterium]|nr:thiamine-phosphate kinase [Nitrospirota bacterium]